jgi:D-amino peptidase
LHEKGFAEIVVADSHGPMVNLLIDNLPEYVEVIRGNPRPTSMVTGVDECDVALFIGYHAKMGTAKSTFDHTYSGGSIHNVKVNDIVASEFLLNAYVAGHYKVPVILVAGDYQLLEDDVKVHTPWAEAVQLKKSLSRISARSPSMSKINTELKEAVRRAVKKFKDKKTKPISVKDVTMRVTFRNSLFADVAELLPIIIRINGLTVEYKAKDMVEAYKIFEHLAIAAGGINARLQNLR